MGASASEWKMMQKMNKYLLLEQCWSEDAMTEWGLKLAKACEFCGEVQAPLFGGNGLSSFPNGPSNNQNSFGRKKRQAGLLNPTEEDKEEFLEDFMDLKMAMGTAIGNLTCVMTQLQMLDAAGNINIDMYTGQQMKEWARKTPAGSDPAFMKKMTNKMSDCYDISRSWPQVALDRNPLTKKYGRHMVFFECAKKVEKKLCSMFVVKKWLTKLYGNLDKLPEMLGMEDMDVYDASAWALKTLCHGATDEMKFVDDFFWQKSKF